MLENNYSSRLHEAGVDEVGRGAIAGPVTAASVILMPDFYHPDLNDSKKMSPSKRKIVAEYIKANCVCYGIASISPDRIDKVNILNASIEAMHKAIRNMNKIPDFIIVDGNQFMQYKKNLNNDMYGNRIIPHKCIIKGDSKYSSIAAASVLAKVHRDEYMKNLGREFPQYGWETNSGYGVKKHYNALLEHGITKYHRKSFSYPGK